MIGDADTIHVPVTRFKREMRKWLRVCETRDVMVTCRGEVKFVVVGHDRHNKMIQVIDAGLEHHGTNRKGTPEAEN